MRVESAHTRHLLVVLRKNAITRNLQTPTPLFSLFVLFRTHFLLKSAGYLIVDATLTFTTFDTINSLTVIVPPARNSKQLHH